MDRITQRKATELNTFLQKNIGTSKTEIQDRNTFSPKQMDRCSVSTSSTELCSGSLMIQQRSSCFLVCKKLKNFHLWNLLTWSFRLNGSEATHRTRVLAAVIGGLLIVSWMATSDSFCRCGNQRLLIDLRRLV